MPKDYYVIYFRQSTLIHTVIGGEVTSYQIRSEVGKQLEAAMKMKQVDKI